MSDKTERVKQAAEEGWNAFIQKEEAKGFAPTGTVKKGEETPLKPFKDLSPFEKYGLYHAVAAMIANPLEEPYASFMPANHDRKEYRALDDCLRDALGFARYDHQ